MGHCVTVQDPYISQKTYKYILHAIKCLSATNSPYDNFGILQHFPPVAVA